MSSDECPATTFPVTSFASLIVMTHAGRMVHVRFDSDGSATTLDGQTHTTYPAASPESAFLFRLCFRKDADALGFGTDSTASTATSA